MFPSVSPHHRPVLFACVVVVLVVVEKQKSVFPDTNKM